MAEKDTSTWDVYDWLDVMENNRLKRRCPKCGEDDVKFAVHSKRIVGVELSVRCNSCGKEDTGNNSGQGAERLVREWHEQPAIRGAAMKFGDHVEYDLRASHGGDIEQGYVIGSPHYADLTEIAVLATSDVSGMPINVGHCRVIGSDEKLAVQLREKYVSRYPGFLKPLDSELSIPSAGSMPGR